MSQRIENIVSGNYSVAVQAENDEGASDPWPNHDDDTDQHDDLVYTIGQLEPLNTEDIQINLVTDDDNKIVAEISWPRQEGVDLSLSGKYLYVTSPEGNTVEDSIAHRVRDNETAQVDSQKSKYFFLNEIMLLDVLLS